MRLLFLVTYYKPHWTGLTQYAISLGEGLAKKGFKIRVVTTQHEQNLPEEENINEVSVKRSPILFRLSRTMISLKLFRDMYVEAKRNDKAVIFLPYAEVLPAALIFWALKKPFYLIYNGDLVLNEGWVNKIVEWIFVVSTKRAIALAEGVIVNTKDYARQSKVLAKYEKKWIELLPPFPALGHVKAKKIHNKPVVGFAGRFVREKGFDVLLEAMPMVAKKIPGVQFVFAGETKMAYENTYATYEALLAKNKLWLKILGKLDREQMKNFYSTCDAFVISSRSDFFPFVQAEALMAGVPVIVTDIPGARWPVQKTKMGVVVEKENPTALADGIIRVLKNKASYTKHARAVADVFDYQRTVEQYATLFA